jgi:hypothetical protein
VGGNAQRLDVIGRPTAAGRERRYHVIRSAVGTPVGSVLLVREDRR